MTRDQWRWYQTAAEFYKNEMATLGWRTNVFIVAQSILVGGFILLLVNRLSSSIPFPKNVFLLFGIATVGFLYCVVHLRSGWSASKAAAFWRAYMYELEEDSRKTEGNLEVGAPWHALCKYYREKRHELRWFKRCRQQKKWEKLFMRCKQIKALPLHERDLLNREPGPASWFILPAISGLAWLIAVGLVLWVT